MGRKIRTKKAITIFIEYWEENHTIITKEEFDEIWKGATKYYFQIRNQFETLMAQGLI